MHRSHSTLLSLLLLLGACDKDSATDPTTDPEAGVATVDGHHGPRGGRWHAKDPAERAAKILAKLDADGDGALVPAEVADRPRLAEHFAELDADGDGKLTGAELAAIDGPPGMDPERRADKLLARFDADGDGVLVLAEVEDHPRLAEKFAAADGDGDGKLTRAELVAFKAAHPGGHGRGHGPKHGGKHGERDTPAE